MERCEFVECQRLRHAKPDRRSEAMRDGCLQAVGRLRGYDVSANLKVLRSLSSGG